MQSNARPQPADLDGRRGESGASPGLSRLRENALAVAEGMDRLNALLRREPGLASLSDKLEKEARGLRENRFTIMVVGEFNRGKSTLLNAMLGGVVLPQKNVPCTAIITAIRYGEPPRVRVVFEASEHRPDEVMDPKTFNDKYQLQIEDSAYRYDTDADAATIDAQQRALNEKIRDRFGNIDHAEVEFPIALCREGVQLVDSPGLEDDPARDRRVFEYLREAHAIVMILDALALLNAREIRFIQQTLRPLGLNRKIFFVINRWNLVLESLIDPNDEQELRQAYRNQEELIEARLKPLCVVDGRDLSAERIFRVNALGALQQRKVGTPSPTKLEETSVPAFERSLAAYLVSERLRERQAHDLATLDAVLDGVDAFARRSAALADKPLEELERKATELQPKLDRLRDVRRQIENYFAAKAAAVSADLARQFDAYAKEEIEKPLPQAVRGWPLGRLDRLLMSFDAALDLFRPEGKKFKDAVAAHLDALIQDYFKAKIASWTVELAEGHLAKVSLEIQRDLEAEAGRYLEILGDIDAGFGIDEGRTSIKEQLDRWLADLKGQSGFGGARGVSVDLAPIITSIGIDVAAHAALHWVPGIGFLVSGILMVLRRNRVRNKVREQVVAGLLSEMENFRFKQHEGIRAGVESGLKRLSAAIAAKIETDIALIDGNIQQVIAERRERQTALDEERGRLARFRGEVASEASRTRRLLDLVAV